MPESAIPSRGLFVSMLSFATVNVLEGKGDHLVATFKVILDEPRLETSRPTSVTVRAVRGLEIVLPCLPYKRAPGCRNDWSVERRGRRTSALAPLCAPSVARTRATVDLPAAAECAAERPERRRPLRGSVFHQAEECARSSSEHAGGVWLLVAVPGQLYREPRPPRRHAFPRNRNRSNRVFFNSVQPRPTNNA